MKLSDADVDRIAQRIVTIQEQRDRANYKAEIAGIERHIDEEVQRRMFPSQPEWNQTITAPALPWTTY